jgi:hypothetical protein
MPTDYRRPAVNIGIATLRIGSLVFIVTTALAAADAQQIGVPQVTQQHSEWCWAADANAVLSYRRISSTQCGIANWADSVGYACENAPFGWYDAVNSPNTITGTTGISGILWSLGRRDSRYYDGPLSYDAIRMNIDRGNPIVALWTWRYGGGHFIVVDGHDDREGALYFMNPWPGEGAGYGDYDWVRHGSGNMGIHTWAESLVVY